MKITLNRNNDQYLTVGPVTDALSGAPINAATVAAAIVDDTGLTVWSSSLSSVDQLGNYRASIPNSFKPPVDDDYVLTVTVTVGALVNTIVKTLSVIERNG